MTARPDDDYLPVIEADHRLWRYTLFPERLSENGLIVPDAGFQLDYWDWLWSIRPTIRPQPFVGVWFRGAAKSTNAQIGATALGARRIRRYAWYVSETQDQSNLHVENTADLLESAAFGAFYPEMASRRIGKYGPRGWRRNRLDTAAGFAIDAIGLDTAARGRRHMEQRPDLIVVDDIDDAEDTAAGTAKKIRNLTRRIFGAAAGNVAIIAIQNLVKDDGVFGRLVAGDADYLADAHISGPVPAIIDPEISAGPHPTGEGNRWFLTAGTPTWVGYDTDRAEADINALGPTSWKAEAQHDTTARAGTMFSHLDFEDIRVERHEVPDLDRVTVWVDPAVTATDGSDAQAIQCDGILRSKRLIYRLYSYEQWGTPLDTLKRAYRVARQYGADTVGVETDQGGDTWKSVWREAVRAVDDEDGAPDYTIRFDDAKAGQGHGPKRARAARHLTQYEDFRVRHVIGTHLVLERALNRFPETAPLDLVDAGYWSVWDLLGKPEPRTAPPDQASGRRPGTEYDADRKSRWR